MQAWLSRGVLSLLLAVVFMGGCGGDADNKVDQGVGEKTEEREKADGDIKNDFKPIRDIFNATIAEFKVLEEAENPADVIVAAERLVKLSEDFQDALDILNDTHPELQNDEVLARELPFLQDNSELQERRTTLRKAGL